MPVRGGARAGRGRGGAGPEREPSSCPGYPPPTTQGRVPRIAPRRHRQETRKGSLWPWWIKAARELLPPDPGHLKPHPEVLSLARPRAGPAKGQRETAVRRPRPDHRLAAPRPGPIQRCGCTRAAGKEGRGGSRPGEGAPPRAAGPDPAASSRAHARTGALGVEATLSTCARALGSRGWVSLRSGSQCGRPGTGRDEKLPEHICASGRPGSRVRHIARGVGLSRLGLISPHPHRRARRDLAGKAQQMAYGDGSRYHPALRA